MSMRLQEVHPALVHYPIALLPTSLAADALGKVTGSEGLLELGRRTMPLAAASALVSGVFGLISQQAVKLDDDTTDMLITHRNLNLGLIGLTAVMANKRRRRKKPSAGYLAAGLAGMAVMAYSAYLGGHMVYEHGVGVSAADGLNEEAAPKLTPGNAREVTRMSGELLQQGAKLTAQETGEGKLFPWLRAEGGHAPRKVPAEGMPQSVG